jgi:hypothetical protein
MYMLLLLSAAANETGILQMQFPVVTKERGI